MNEPEGAENLGVRTRQRVMAEAPPRADLGALPCSPRGHEAVDILFANPPAPDGGIWIRSQHRVGRRSREGMIWPQADLAQMAALFPDTRVAIVDAIAARMSWRSYEAMLDRLQPRAYVTQVTGPTLQNDMYGAFLARARGAATIAFGTHVTPMPIATLDAYPALDYVLYGEPELTLRELMDVLLSADDGVEPGQPWDALMRVDPSLAERLAGLFRQADPRWAPATARGTTPAERLASIPGLAWRPAGRPTINPPRALLSDLDALPLPRHDLLPLQRYRAPLVKGPYAFVVTSRGCPAGCEFCIKHVSYGRSVRFRSPDHILAEVEQLIGLGVRSIHMYADLFTVNRDHVMGICQGLLDRGLRVRWTCNSRVDFVDREMLHLMARSGCWMISWGIESGDEEMLRRMHKGVKLEAIHRALAWAREAGIRNWGYFIIGLPGESVESIRATIALAKALPLELALFHIAAPHPGTPLFSKVIENGWFRPGARWEQVDMDRSTVLDYPDLPAEELECWARRAMRAWAMRPGPLWTYAKMLLGSPSLWRSALQIGWESVGWMRGAGKR